MVFGSSLVKLLLRATALCHPEAGLVRIGLSCEISRSMQHCRYALVAIDTEFQG